MKSGHQFYCRPQGILLSDAGSQDNASVPYFCTDYGCRTVAAHNAAASLLPQIDDPVDSRTTRMVPNRVVESLLARKGIVHGKRGQLDFVPSTSKFPDVRREPKSPNKV